MNYPTGTKPGPRPVGVVHLVFGLIFCGIAALWMIGTASNADVPNLARGIPAVLIGAGLVGLGASYVNHRRAKARQSMGTTDEPVDEFTDEPVDEFTDEPDAVAADTTPAHTTPEDLS